jgi:hypothetical protein
MRSLSPLSPLALLLAAVCLALPACGDDDDGGGSERQAFVVEATDDGVTAPRSVRPGAIELRFRNTGKREHGAQLIALGEGHDAAEALEAGQAWGEKGRPLPGWLRFVGGVGATRAGGTGIAVVDLPPGEYAVLDIEGEGPRPYAEFTAEGAEGAALADVPARVEALEYSFEAESLEDGSQRVLFENVGDEPHHLIGAPLRPGKTAADVERFLKQERTGHAGPPPIVEGKGFDTAIISGGTSTVVDIRLERGKYAFLCFVPDRKGGPPHAFRGMATVASVD